MLPLAQRSFSLYWFCPGNVLVKDFWL